MTEKSTLQILQEIFPDNDHEMILKYLSGIVEGKHQSRVLVLSGEGSNGKTTLCRLVDLAIPEKSTHMRYDILTMNPQNIEITDPIQYNNQWDADYKESREKKKIINRISENQSSVNYRRHISGLIGSHFASIEFEEGRPKHWNYKFIENITEQENLLCQKLYQNPQYFENKVSLIICTNYSENVPESSNIIKYYMKNTFLGEHLTLTKDHGRQLLELIENLRDPN